MLTIELPVRRRDAARGRASMSRCVASPMSHFVACLDVWAPAVREVVRRTAPPELDLHFATSYDDAEQMGLVENAEFLLPGWAAVTEPMLTHAKKLRMIQKWGIGYDRIDVDAARKRGIPLAITAGSNAGPVAELAIALMLAVYRRIPYNTSAMRAGKWPKAEMRETCFQIAGKTVGLVGFGNIGRMLARRLRGFDCARDLFRRTARRSRDRAGAQCELRAACRAARAKRHREPARAVHAADGEDDQRRVDRDDEGRRDPHQHGARRAGRRKGALRRACRAASCAAQGSTRSIPSRPSADNPLLKLDQVVSRRTPAAACSTTSRTSPGIRWATS